MTAPPVFASSACSRPRKNPYRLEASSSRCRAMMGALVDYYRCPPDLAPIGTRPDLSIQDGFFKVGDAIGYGRVAGSHPATYASDPLRNVIDDVAVAGGKAWLPFDLSEVATNI